MNESSACKHLGATRESACYTNLHVNLHAFGPQNSPCSFIKKNSSCSATREDSCMQTGAAKIPACILPTVHAVRSDRAQVEACQPVT
ncbi:hypothetical protein V6N13_092481 [Hibiscus sabdariffa]|uniref:Uncharacterized protein n=2 Tax=Hibiscus sabdariffa TaxID=183260 RepID=A0ABR1ZWG6_9ROSI